MKSVVKLWIFTPVGNHALPAIDCKFGVTVKLLPVMDAFPLTTIDPGNPDPNAIPPPPPETTVNPLISDALSPSVSVTTTLWPPITAFDAIDRVAEIFVAELYVHALTVSPWSESKSHDGFAKKFVPVITTLIFDCPAVPELGLTDVIVGGLAVPVCTVNPFGSVPVCPSLFVIETLRGPAIALLTIFTLAVMLVGETYVHELTVTPGPRMHAAPLTKLAPVIAKLRLTLPCSPVFGPTLLTVGAGPLATVIVRTGGLGSVFPAVSVTFSDTLYTPAVAKVTFPGFASVLFAGEPPRNTHEYPVIDPLLTVPVPAKFTAWPGAIVTSVAGLVIVALGGTSVGALSTCTIFATDGTPALFNRNNI